MNASYRSYIYNLSKKNMLLVKIINLNLIPYNKTFKKLLIIKYLIINN